MKKTIADYLIKMYTDLPQPEKIKFKRYFQEQLEYDEAVKKLNGMTFKQAMKQREEEDSEPMQYEINEPIG